MMPRSVAEVSRSAPPYVPKAVRAPSMMTMSFTKLLPDGHRSRACPPVTLSHDESLEEGTRRGPTGGLCLERGVGRPPGVLVCCRYATFDSRECARPALGPPRECVALRLRGRVRGG